MTSNAGDTAEWDRLWVSQSGGALRDSDPANVALEDFWTKIFSKYSGKLNVLDIACGNCVLAGYIDKAVEESGGKINYVGVDKALIDPPPSSRFKNLYPEFFPNQAIEEASFETAKFDLIISQFGFEYCDRERITELASSWIRPGGRMILIVHSSASAITLASKQVIEQLRLLEECALVPLIYRLLDRLDKISGGKPEEDKEAEFLRGRINTTVTDLQSISENLLEPKFLEGTIAVLLSLFSSKRNHIPPSVRNENLFKLSRDLQHYQSRLKQQIASALNTEDLHALRSLQESNGFEKVNFSPLIHIDEEIGQVVDALSSKTFLDP